MSKPILPKNFVLSRSSRCLNVVLHFPTQSLRNRVRQSKISFESIFVHSETTTSRSVWLKNCFALIEKYFLLLLEHKTYLRKVGKKSFWKQFSKTLQVIFHDQNKSKAICQLSRLTKKKFDGWTRSKKLFTCFCQHCRKSVINLEHFSAIKIFCRPRSWTGDENV